MNVMVVCMCVWVGVGVGGDGVGLGGGGREGSSVCDLPCDLPKLAIPRLCDSDSDDDVTT